MKFLFRVDASNQIGTGHVMRCLTLAQDLRHDGHECSFACRLHVGNVIEYVSTLGFHVYRLSNIDECKVVPQETSSLFHATWLGVDQEYDAFEVLALIGQDLFDWIVVDHYGIDIAWETIVAASGHRVMVIDDLADRRHLCDILLDQTYGRERDEYSRLVSTQCRVITGSDYALLRPDFAKFRPLSLARRKQPELKRLLISLGGVDKDNVTGLILRSLPLAGLPNDCDVTIVMGQNAPWLEDITQVASQLPWSNRVLTGVSNMAELMTSADLAIGAAGATSWERCCLGLPTVLVVIAHNQLSIAFALETVGAALVVSDTDSWGQCTDILNQVCRDQLILKRLSDVSQNIVDGMGSSRVIESLLSHEDISFMY